ncbi:MAG: efflux RND transporter periplasmic adaptor subunit [Gammaproteobacteria bacterium]|nr:efflux RND transporter periplasmic adaptor subunit [Gammaproteobacteria bacterium]MDP6734463.1 efflux RND transporter periplasmic adaptor subunit [Gammaproteobacteria bacterium]
MKLFLASCGGIALCILILLTGPDPLEASLPASKVVVSVGNIERKTTPSTVTTFGTLHPRQILQLTTQVPGKVTWVSDSLVAGGRVANADELLRIDERDYAMAIAMAEASYEQAQANIELERGRSDVARLEWSSWQQSSGKQRDASPLALREPQQAAAKAALKVIQSEIDRANLDLQRTTIKAPWPATVVEVNVIEGQVLSTGEVAATLFPLDHAVVEVHVPITTLHKIDAGVARIELRPVNDETGPPTTGTLEGIVRNLTDNTRLASVRVAIENPLKQVGWAFGMHLQVRIDTLQQRKTAIIPTAMIVGGNLVWVYRDGKARRHQIHPIDSAGDWVIVEDNFASGDELITERPIGLFDGVQVVIASGA